MIVLATAKANVTYAWKSIYQKCTIHAVLENGSIKFIEYFNSNVHTLQEELVMALFPSSSETPDRDCPLLVSDNVDFFTILNRKNMHYKKRYESIIASKTKPKLKRTK